MRHILRYGHYICTARTRHRMAQFGHDKIQERIPRKTGLDNLVGIGIVRQKVREQRLDGNRLLQRPMKHL